MSHGGFSKRGCRALLCAAANLAVGAFALRAQAADPSWLAAANGVFSTGSNWTTNTPPGTSDNAHFSVIGTYTVSFSSSPSNAQMVATGGTVTFNLLGGFTYSLNTISNTSLLIGDLTGGSLTLPRAAHVTIVNGTLSSRAAILGASSVGLGVATVSNATWTTNGNMLTVGSLNTGILDVTTGGTASAGTIIFGGDAGVAGTGSVSGSGAALNSSSRFEVGDAGNGTLLIGSGGVVNCTSASQTIAIADQSGSHGYVGIAGGGRWTTSNDIRVGDGGAGTISLDGGSLSSTGSLFVAPQSGAAGYVSVINGGSMSFAGDAIIDIGSISIGGGTASFRSVNIGALSGATGTLAISGGITNATSNTYVGGGNSGSISTGVLSMSAGAFATTGLLKNWSTGVIHFSGGILSAGSFDLNAGSFDWTGGILEATDDLTIGPGGATPALTIPSGAQIFATAPILVTGSLTSNGGTTSIIRCDGLFCGGLSPGSISLTNASIDIDGDFGVSSGTVTLDHSGATSEHQFFLGGGGVTDTIAGTVRFISSGYSNLGYGTNNSVTNINAGGLLQLDQNSVWSNLPNAGSFTVYSGGTLIVAGGSQLTGFQVSILGDATVTGAASKLAASSITVGIGSFTSGTGGKLTIGPGCNLSSQSISFSSGGAGTFSSDPDPTNAGTLAMTCTGATSRITFGSKVHVGTLTLTSGRADESAGSNAMLVVRNLSINTANGAALDLTNNKAILDYSGQSILPAIRPLIITGRNGGTWNGPGITSTSAATTSGATAIGYADAFALFSTFPNTFAGESIDSSAILIRYTYTGDANLDGTVNTLDFTRLASNFNSTTGLWTAGDFNYDGVVNALDFNALATNFGVTLASPPLGSLVPEPAGVAIVTLLTLICRRRKKFWSTQ